MSYKTEDILDSLIKNLSVIQKVQAIGMSGSKSPLPKAGESDIDIFIYCDSIPELNKREAAIKKLGSMVDGIYINTFQGGHWGTGDLVLINGVETWLMYFTVNEALDEVEAILKGDYPDKLENYYYPVGRCAMLNCMNILYDKNSFLSEIKNLLHDYPDKLAGILIQYHMVELEDMEDLERAAGSRQKRYIVLSLCTGYRTGPFPSSSICREQSVFS